MMVLGLNSLCLIPTLKEICGVLEFIFLFKKYEKKVHNMLFLMLDPKFKSF
jgi:hypothetical protein